MPNQSSPSSTALNQTGPSSTDLAHPIIARYFATVNSGNYSETAALFTEQGELRAPFEAPIARDDIADYLAKEASGMTLHPRKAEPLPNDATAEAAAGDQSEYDIKVSGHVQTPLFGVNVAWLFALQNDAIQAVRIKLLASPQELLKLRG